MGKGAHPSQEPAGSPKVGEPAFVVIGKLHRPHGLRGELVMQVLTDYPERIKHGMAVFIGEERMPVQVRSSRGHKDGLLVAFEGYDNPDIVGAFRNWFVYVDSKTLPELPEGDYYHHQIIGLQIVSDDGKHLGVATGILETGANDICVVRLLNGREALLPMIDEVIVSVNLVEGKMIVHLMPGLVSDT